MAEALVTVLLERLAAITLDKVAEEFKLVSGVKKEVESLTRNLESIRAVLEDAEQKQVTEATVRLWLSDLTEVSFETDDVLDEWITEVLKRRMEKQEKHALAITKKVSSSASSIISGIRRLSHRRKIAGRIRELNEKIASIDERKQRFSFQNTIRVPETQWRETISLPTAKTFGRDNEKNLIVSKLLSETSEAKEVPLIIPIVGMGGMGKTTLAQLVYNDEGVKTHFDERIWVCVSDPFEAIKIAKAIIEGLDINNTSKNSSVLQTLLHCIYELLKGKKFLLVLDDVWNPKSSQWEELIKPLQNGSSGSRILVTTRNENVVDLMKATTQKIPMKELGEKFCLSLFYHNADMDESCLPKQLADIGLEIVKRCNGLPLAAKTLGSLLRNKKTIHEWQAVLKSKTWELKEVQQDVFRPLLLSYHDLTPTTKRCLLYCGFFLKDHVYDKNRLIELWMSQNYLNVKGSNDEMIVGQSYFHDLVMRSFFQDVEVNDKNGNITCKIHDMVHDFLQYLSKNECMILNSELNDSNKKEVPSDSVHHLTVVNAVHSDYLVHYLLNCKRLRTFTAIHPLFSENLTPGALFELIVQLKCLRTITLGPPDYGGIMDMKVPESIGGLMHLRYLDLTDGCMEELPSAIGSLYNLQTLRLVGCRELRKVDVGRLINLRHLYVEVCDELGIIKGIERLTQLQRLDVFYVGDGDEGNKLEDLKDLNQLQGSLTIYMEGNPKMAENAAILVNKPHLLELKLYFRFRSDTHQIMNGLEPHPCLNSLSISNYSGGVFSDWLWSLHSLRFLTLDWCKNCKSFPPLGKLASLESLNIEGLGGVSKVGVEFLGIEEGQTSSSFTSFPKLKKLNINWMWSCEEWEGVKMEISENITIMPCLSELTIWKCEKLKALPDFLWKTPLHKLHIIESPILQNLYREETGEQRAKISHIPNIKLQ